MQNKRKLYTSNWIINSPLLVLPVYTCLWWKGTQPSKKRKIDATFLFSVKFRLFLWSSEMRIILHILRIIEQGIVSILPKILGLDSWLLREGWGGEETGLRRRNCCVVSRARCSSTNLRHSKYWGYDKPNPYKVNRFDLQDVENTSKSRTRTLKSRRSKWD